MVTHKISERMRCFFKKFRNDRRLSGTSEQVFSRIYRRNRWHSEESKSGRDSELSYTKELRRELPILVREYSISRLLDAPCGDFNWMQHVVAELGVKYIGGEVVKELVRQNTRQFGAVGIYFCHIDITRDPLPASDMMMVRDCLFHLSYKDIYLFLENFCRSEIGLLFTTTHLPTEGLNSDIRTGEYRRIHIYSYPFYFPRAPLRRVDDWVPPYPPREMNLFTRGQVAAARDAMKRSLGF